MILLDTSVVLEIVERGPAFELCLEKLQQYDTDQVHISALTVFEVERGLFDGSPNIRRRRALWDRFYRTLLVELVHADTASEGARIVRETAAGGQQIASFDAMIAATAQEWDLTVATRDNDFSRVANLKVEYWR